MIDESVWPEENDLRRRFLSDKAAAFTLLFRFENGRARERDPLALMVNKSPAVFIFIREIDDLYRKSRGSVNRLRRCLLLF